MANNIALLATSIIKLVFVFLGFILFLWISYWILLKAGLFRLMKHIFKAKSKSKEEPIDKGYNKKDAVNLLRSEGGIKELMFKGYKKKDIVDLLRSVGWQDENIKPVIKTYLKLK